MGNELLLFVSIFLSLPSESDNLIRLAGSDKSCSGRIEIYHNGVWGTVCDDGWDLNDTEVACRELGCGPALGALSSAYFGQGTGQIWLDDLVCTGSETSLGMCGHRGFGTHDCQHSEDAGVKCSNQIQPIVTVNPPGNIIWGQSVSIKCSVPDIKVIGTFILKRSTGSFSQSVETHNGSATFYIAHVSFEDEGSFQCHFTRRVLNEEYSSLLSHAVWLNVSLPKPNITMDPAGAVIFGQLVAITCSIPIQGLGGSFTLRKTFGSFNKTQLSNTNSSTFRFLEANNNHVGDYHCYYEKMGKYQKKTSPLSANVTIYLTDV